jgi:2-hydroxy-3-oxopropionate reductase
VTDVAPGSARESAYPRSVGVLGSGFLAGPLTSRLIATLPRGTPVSVFGREPDLLARQQAMGAARAASPADLAARNEVVFFLLGDPGQIEAQLTGPSGFEAGVHSPTIAVIATALAPDDLRGLAHRIADRTAGRLRLVDAPLSGPRSAVLRGEVSVAVGVASSAYPAIAPLLSLLGPCLRVGGIGSAQVAHACEQLMVAATAVGLGEAILVAERAGLDVDALLANWRRSDAAGLLLEAAREQRGSREAEGEQPASLVAGSLEVGAAEAERIGIPARVLAELRTIGNRLEEFSLGHQDLSSGYRTLVAGQARTRPPEATSASDTGAA